MAYAISFELDTEQLKLVYPNSSWQNAYADIKATLNALGFNWRRGSLYFGDNMDAVHCVLAAQKLSSQYPWLKQCLKDIRMLRVEENNDLAPAIMG